MPISRPLSKKYLKKMFIKVLYEHRRPDGLYSNHGGNYDGILRTLIPKYFKISPLTEDEYSEGDRAVFELERDGFIKRDHTQTHSNYFKVLTERGKQVATQSLEDMQLPSVDIDQLLTREDLRNKVHDDFLEGDYEAAIFKAFKFLEEKVRFKAKQLPDVIGVDLMSKAFKPNGGILKHPNAQTPAEEEAFHLIMRGAIMWFKNPSSHRTVGYDNAEQAAQVLCFSNLLLDMVEQC